MKAGFAKVDITPAGSVLMEGHPGTKYSDSVRDPLYARAGVLRDAGQWVVFACADVLFVEKASAEHVIREVCERLPVSPDRVFVSATHTHSGPMTTGLFGKSSESGYIDTLHAGLISAVVEAWNSARDCSAKFELVDAGGFAFSARYIKKDGTVETHPWKYDDSIMGPQGPVDNDLAVFTFSDAEKGDVLGLIYNYANHPQVMERQCRLLSADFPGVIESTIRAEFGDGAIAVFLNGACGDICPVNALDRTVKEVGEFWLEHMGKALGDIVCSAAESEGYALTGGIRAVSGSVSLKLRELSDDIVSKAEAFLAEHNEKDELLVSNYGVENEGSEFISLEDYIHTNEWLVQQYTDQLDLCRRKKAADAETVKISAVDLCGIAVVALPFEVFTDVALDIKRSSPFERTIVIELTNGASGYLPTREAFARVGGYETITLCSSRFDEESADRVVGEALRLLGELKESRNGDSPKQD